MLDLAGRAFLTLFVVIDPVGMAPLFLGLTPSASGAERRRIAGRAVIAAALVLLAFAVGGAWFLRQIGVNVITRVLGILLSALAVQYVADGGRHLLSGG